ncbi:VWA domain-containing protein [Aggregicoccus sp. 17bor-14]|uniref:VWA domain-containing protein n=1 Tax=Myxococcaceae TaxID=31 RepID=UPI00129D1E34|nr:MULTISPECIES: VWA domain-containing protein [Myxococcaceae]MBF5044359.1 VWA domain-containing protein [Simulacricoccus sp. 17bor-14]MRI90106.1 VWA domain-containing protein [Aggregicoccus sp. 17bor-14]
METTPWRFTLLGYNAGLAQPAFLALALVGLVLGALALVVGLRRRARLARVLPERHAARLAPGVSRTRPAAQGALYGAGLMLLGVALAQPQCGSTSEVVKKRGIDVVVALDASKSMLARDVAPSRLERAKLELTTLLDELKGDRVGLVVFAGEAFVQSPLTSDYAAAKLFLSAVSPEQMPQGGSNIGGALRLAKQVLDGADRGAKERVVVLLSDGEDLTGEVEESVADLKEAGIPVLAVGVGSESGEPIPLTNRRGEFVDYQKDRAGQTVITRLDRAGLTRIAEATGGAFFYQQRGVAMSQVLERIEKMQKSELESRVAVRYDERFQSFAVPGLLLLVLGMLLLPSRRRAA